MLRDVHREQHEKAPLIVRVEEVVGFQKQAWCISRPIMGKGMSML
jgi:hypothetical protein